MPDNNDKELFKPDDHLYFVDLTDGIVEDCRFMEYDTDGLWIRLKGRVLNKFIYADKVGELLSRDKEAAEEMLAKAKSDTKSYLLQNNRFIRDIINRLSKQEGRFYTGIIEEILTERIIKD